MSLIADIHQPLDRLNSSITEGRLTARYLPVGTAWASESVLLGVSFGLLVLSTADSDLVGLVVKVSWLASLAALTCVNIGAAFALYIASSAIYSPLHYPGWGSLSERPDNYALIIVFTGMFILALRKCASPRQLHPYVIAFMALAILHGFVYSRNTFPALFRDIQIPLLGCECAALIGFRERELHAFQDGMAALGAYMGLVSILERLSASDWILPPWVGDLSLRPPDEFLEAWSGSGRSGGTLLQPAFNGLLLTLIIIILLPRLRRATSWPLVAAISLCLAGDFFTYTRGVWLGLAVALLWFPGWARSRGRATFRRAWLVIATVVLLVAARGMASQRLEDSGTVFYRFNLWGAALRLAMAHPLLGVGFFNFGTAMTNVEQGLGSLVPNLGRDVEEGVASHNTVLTILVEFGLVGLALYATMFWKTLRRATTNIRRLEGREGGAWVVAFAIGYLVNAQFISAFEGTFNMAFFGFLGILAGANLNGDPFGQRNGTQRSA